MNDVETSYDVLGITKNADKEAIKRAYRALVKRYHPDNPGGNIEKFKQIQDAYSSLCRVPVQPQFKKEETPVTDRSKPKKKYFFFHIIDPLVRRMPAQDIMNLVMYSGNYLVRRQAIYVLYERREAVVKTMIFAAKKDQNVGNRAIAHDFLVEYLSDCTNIIAVRDFWIAADVSEKYVILVYLIENNIKGYKNVVSRSIQLLPLFLQVKVRKYLQL